MARYLGIDVHRDSSTICVLSATGKRVTHEVVETNGHALVDYIRRLRGKLHVCIEEGTWSEWLYEILSPHVVELVVYQNEWTPGAKSDAIDAHGLAEKLWELLLVRSMGARAFRSATFRTNSVAAPLSSDGSARA